jgi:ribonuclease HI
MQSLALRWKRHGWRNGRGLLLKDWRLWEELLELEKAHRIDWQWVRGHNGHPMQTQADALAYSAARQDSKEEKRRDQSANESADTSKGLDSMLK